MEEDILNYSPIVMFRGTPCIYTTVQCVGTVHYSTVCWYYTLQYSVLVLYTTVQCIGTVHYSTVCWYCTLQYSVLGLYTTVQCVGTVHYSKVCWYCTLQYSVLVLYTIVQCVGTVHYSTVCWYCTLQYKNDKSFLRFYIQNFLIHNKYIDVTCICNTVLKSLHYPSIPCTVYHVLYMFCPVWSLARSI